MLGIPRINGFTSVILLKSRLSNRDKIIIGQKFIGIRNTSVLWL